MNRMRELVDRLNETAYQYYTLDKPTISDKEWDALYDELVKLDHPKCAFFSGSDPNSYLSLAKDGLKVAMAAIDRQLAK